MIFILNLIYNVFAILAIIYAILHYKLFIVEMKKYILIVVDKVSEWIKNIKG